MAATCQPIGFKQLRPKQPPFKVEPVVDDLIRHIVHQTADERLEWTSDGDVKIIINKIDELNTEFQQTRADRRKRFREALDKGLAEAGWEKIGHYRFRPPHPHP